MCVSGASQRVKALQHRPSYMKQSNGIWLPSALITCMVCWMLGSTARSKRITCGTGPCDDSADTVTTRSSSRAIWIAP